MIEKEYLQKVLIKLSDESYDKLSSFKVPRPFFIFPELSFYVQENIACLSIGSYTSSITLSNFILERLLKLALIEDELKLMCITHPWEKCHNKISPFFSLKTEHSIKQCKNRDIITEAERMEIGNHIKIYRHGFAHADTNNIFKNFPETYTVKYGAPFNDEIEFNLKKDHFVQFSFLQEFAKSNAIQYLEYVINLTFKIEKRLREKHPINRFNPPKKGL